MQNDIRYDPVAAALPEVLPAITMDQALRAYRRLVRAFGGVRHGPVGMERPVRAYRESGRRCWASTKPTNRANHDNGWGRLIHDASHYVFQRRHPNFRPHDSGHATLEREMSQYVVSHCMLDKYRPAPKKRLTHDAKIAKCRDSIKRWESKAKRAQTALRKLKRRLAALERQPRTVVVSGAKSADFNGTYEVL
jgi:hypothetical protein